jgi:hypothetical protein
LLGLLFDPKDGGDVTPKYRAFSEINSEWEVRLVLLIRSSFISVSHVRFSRITEENLYL